ncbi:S1 family peptidase [Amycolatopsis sacchari]|uniref:S1 family peptidase n=1 Tax=Amycolatopsis sacchari TaxID=115433 RepID=UPI003D717C31
MPARTLAVCATALALAMSAVTPAFAVSGGQAVSDPATAPWMATIARKGTAPLVQRELCGGVLIAPDRIATAAHCLDHTDPTNLEVHVGGGTLSTDPGRVVPMKGFTTHPGYRLISPPGSPGDFAGSAAADDAAIIELARPVRGVPVLPVARHTPAPGTPVAVFGHGQTGPYDPQNPLSSYGDALNVGRMTVLDHASCDEQLAGVVDAASVVCAQAAGTTICAGDSGGPLVEYGDEGPALVGLTSFGGEVRSKQCGQDVPGGFADAAKLRSFLTQRHPVLAPRPTGEPAITGTKAPGSTLTCQAPGWAGRALDSVTYTWDEGLVDSTGFVTYVPIKGAPQTPTLALNADLASHSLLCVLVAQTRGGVVELVSDPR